MDNRYGPWELPEIGSGLASENPINADAAALHQIGKPMPIAEDRRFVRGRGRYVNDLDFPGMLHMTVATAPVAHARVISVDVSEARRVPGVVTVLTGAEVAERMEPIPQEADIPTVKWYPLAVDKVRLSGEYVAAVVATSRAVAEDAAELVQVEYEELRPLVDPEAALLPDAPLLHEEHGSNVCWQRSLEFGPLEEAFAQAEHVFEYRFRWNRHSGVPMETFGCVCYVDRSSGLLEVYASHQNPGIQQEMLEVLRLPSLRVHMDVDIGGSYGSKRGRKQMYLTALAAMETGRPVKFIEDRVQNMQSSDGHGPDRVYRVKMAVTRDGVIDAADINVVEDLGAYCGRGVRQLDKPLVALVGPYKIRAVRYGGYGVFTCKSNQVPFRGGGQAPHNFAIERAVDRVARALGIDPVAFRLRNYIQPDEFPYEIPAGGVYDSGNYPGAMDMAVAKGDLAGLRRVQADARREGRLVGIGVAGGIEPGGGGGRREPEGARIEIEARGHVVVTIGFQSAGQSHESMVTQIASEELGVDPGKVTVQRGHGLSGVVGGATTGSRMTVMLGSAMKLASDKMNTKIRLIAADALEADPDDIVVERGRYSLAGAPDRWLTLEDVAARAYGVRGKRPNGIEPGLVIDAVFPGPSPLTRVEGARSFATYAFDVHIPVVEVDPETFEIRFLRYIVVHDCGVAMNPLVVHGFVYGGIGGHGVGGALYEHFRYDEEGQLVASTFMDYLMPTAAEAPRMELYEQTTPSPLHPYGAKGTGEGSYLTAPSAIASAVEDALAPLGLEIDQIPITPQYLYDLTRQPPPERTAVAAAPSGRLREATA